MAIRFTHETKDRHRGMLEIVRSTTDSHSYVVSIVDPDTRDRASYQMYHEELELLHSDIGRLLEELFR